jgi:hypothetical protein
LGRKYLPELQGPAPDGLIGNINAALGEQVLDIAETQRKAEIQPDRKLDDFGRKPMAAIAELFHSFRLSSVIERTSLFLCDNAVRRIEKCANFGHIPRAQ